MADDKKKQEPIVESEWVEPIVESEWSEPIVESEWSEPTSPKSTAPSTKGGESGALVRPLTPTSASEGSELESWTQTINPFADKGAVKPTQQAGATQAPKAKLLKVIPSSEKKSPELLKARVDTYGDMYKRAMDRAYTLKQSVEGVDNELKNSKAYVDSNPNDQNAINSYNALISKRNEMAEMARMEIARADVWQKGIEKTQLEIDDSLTASESISNSISNMATQIKGFLPASGLAISTLENKIQQGVLYVAGKLMGADDETASKVSVLASQNLPSAGILGTTQKEARQFYTERLGELEKEQKPTKSIIKTFEEGDVAGLGAAILDGGSSILSSVITSAPTGGVGIFTEMMGRSVYDSNNEKAKRLKISVDELYDRGLDEAAVPLAIGAVSASLEKIGLDGISKAINKKIGSKALKDIFEIILEGSKEAGTEWLQTGAEEYNKALARGMNAEQAGEVALSKMLSEEGREAALKGAAGSGVSIATGRAAKSLYGMAKSNRDKLYQDLAKVETLARERANPNLSSEALSSIDREINNTTANMQKEVLDQLNRRANLTEENASLVEGIEANVKTISDDIESKKLLSEDPSLSDDAKIIIDLEIADLEAKRLDLAAQSEEIIKNNRPIELKKNTSPTSDKYGTINRNDGKGVVDLTKEEFEAEQTKMQPKVDEQVTPTAEGERVPKTKEEIDAEIERLKKEKENELNNVGIKQKERAFSQLRDEKDEDGKAIKVRTPEEKLNAINSIERNVAEGSSLTKEEQKEVQKIKDELASEGYEVPSLLGKQFHQGMKVIVASSIPDESLAEGEEVITKVLTPQINKDDKMVQAAQVEVTVGTKKGGLTREQWLEQQKKKEKRTDKINAKYDSQITELEKQYEKEPTKKEDGEPMSGGVQGVRPEGQAGKESAELRPEEKEVADPLKDVESTAKALKGVDAKGIEQKVLPNVIDIYKIQDDGAERILERRFKPNRVWAYKIENAGDIIRELSKYKNEFLDPSYIYEKVNKIEKFLKDQKEQYRVAADDSYFQFKRQNEENVKDFISAYKDLPTMSEAQSVAKKMVLDLLDGNIDEAQKGIDYFNEIRKADDIKAELQKRNKYQISEAYHADKSAGKETDLTRAVEQLLGKPKEATPQAGSVIGGFLKIDNKDTFYHASNTKRSGRLKPGTAQQFGKGVYFSTNKELAKSEFGEEVTEAKLALDNPVYTNTKEWGKVEELALKKANEGKPKDEDGYIIGEETDIYEIKANFISDAAKELGYDAIIDENSSQYENEIVVLDESKIKYPEDLEQSLQSTPTTEEKVSGGLTQEEKVNLENISKDAGVNFQEVRNVYNKYGKGKPLNEITLEDYQKAEEKRQELLTPKQEEDAKKQQSGQMREQGVQDQPQRKGDSDMPIINEAELQDGEAVEEEVTQEELNKQQDKETQVLLNGEAAKRRSAGKFIKDGVEYVRNKVDKGIRGIKGSVKFAEGVPNMPFTYKLVEAETLQPSHSQGVRNQMHFIPEAQPKRRNDEGSVAAEIGFANNPRFNELGENTNAYSGAPIVNERNEVVQGNNRSAGLKIGYDRGNKKYKNDLADNAEKFGFTREQVEGMKNPILVREVAFSDEGAIEYGNYDAKDLETGGKRRIDPLALVKRIPLKEKARLAKLLFSGEGTLNSNIRANSKDVLAILNPFLNQAQRTTLLKDGEITSSGVEDIEALVQQFLFDNGDMALPELFENLPYRQREGIRKSLPFIFSAGVEADVIPEIQNAILALNQFQSTGIENFDTWLNQSDVFADNKTPRDIYTPQELAIARALNEAKTQSEIVDKFKSFSSAVQGTPEIPANLIDEAKPAIEGQSKEEALKQIFNVKENESRQKENLRGGKKVDRQQEAPKQKPKEPTAEEVEEEGLPKLTKEQQIEAERRSLNEPKNVSDLAKIFNKILGLSPKESVMAARLFDVKAKNMSELLGITKDEYYQRYWFTGEQEGGLSQVEAWQGKENFEKWKGGNKLVSKSDIQDIKTGEPVVVRVYHGTTNEFYEFDASVKGNIEGHLGKVNYFTSDYQDAANNYQAEGKDLTSRIESRAEQIESELEYEYGNFDSAKNEIAKKYGYTKNQLTALGDFRSVAKDIASKELKGGTERVLDLYVKLNNPVVLGSGSTWFDTLNISEIDLEQAAQEIADENDISIEDAKDEYSYEIRDRAVENTGSGSLVAEALQDALNSNGYSNENAFEILGDNIYEEAVDLNKLEKDLRKAGLYENDEGEMASSQVIADFFKNLGFDGIILTDVSERFKGMGLGGSTSHIHLFDEFANQIKIADGSNVTFGETKNILFQERRGAWSKIAASAKRIISMYDKARLDTAVHEILGHDFLDEIISLSATNKEFEQDLNTIIDEYIKSSGNKTSKATLLNELKNFNVESNNQSVNARAIHEWFSRTAEGYFMGETNIKPDSELAKTFEQFRQYLTDLFNTMTSRNYIIPSEPMKQIFRKAFGAENFDFVNDYAEANIMEGKLDVLRITENEIPQSRLDKFKKLREAKRGLGQEEDVDIDELVDAARYLSTDPTVNVFSVVDELVSMYPQKEEYIRKHSKTFEKVFVAEGKKVRETARSVYESEVVSPEMKQRAATIEDLFSYTPEKLQEKMEDVESLIADYSIDDLMAFFATSNEIPFKEYPLFLAAMQKRISRAINELDNSNQGQSAAKQKLLNYEMTIMDRYIAEGTATGQRLNYFKVLKNMSTDGKLRFFKRKFKEESGNAVKEFQDLISNLRKERDKAYKDNDYFLEENLSLEQRIEDLEAELAKERSTKARNDKRKDRESSTSNYKNPPKRKISQSELNEILKNLSSAGLGQSFEDLNDALKLGFYIIQDKKKTIEQFTRDWNKITKQNKTQEELSQVYRDVRKYATENEGVDIDDFDSDAMIQSSIDSFNERASQKKNLAKKELDSDIAKAEKEAKDKDDAPSQLAKAILSNAKKELGLGKKQQDYVKELLGYLKNKAKDYYKTTNKQALVDPFEQLKYAVEMLNDANGRKIWDDSKAELIAKIDSDKDLSQQEKDDLKAYLDDYQNAIFDQLLSKNKLFNNVKKVLAEESPFVKKDGSVDWNGIIIQAKGNVEIAKQIILDSVADKLQGYSGSQVNSVIDAIGREYQRRINEKRAEIIEKQLKDISDKKVIFKKKIATGFVQKLVEMENSGALGDQRFEQALKEWIGFSDMTPDKWNRLRELIVDAEEAPEGNERDRAIENLSAYIKFNKIGKFAEIYSSAYYAGLLARPTTIIKNSTGIIEPLLTLFYKSFTDRNYAKAMLQGLKRGDAADIWGGGLVQGGKLDEEVGNDGLPRVNMLKQWKMQQKGIIPKLFALGAKPLDLLSMADALSQAMVERGAEYEFYARYLLEKNKEDIRNGVQGVAPITEKEARRIAIKRLSDDAMLDWAFAQAEDEFASRKIVPSSARLNRRAYEIVSESLLPTSVRELAQNLALEESYKSKLISFRGMTAQTRAQKRLETNYGVATFIGSFAKGLVDLLAEGGGYVAGATTKVLPVTEARRNQIRNSVERAISMRVLPFARGISNVVEKGLEKTPYGIVSGVVGATAEKLSYGKPKTIDEILQHQYMMNRNKAKIAKSATSMIIGSAIYYTLLSASKEWDDEEEKEERYYLPTGFYSAGETVRFGKNKIERYTLPVNCVVLYGRIIPLSLFGTVGIGSMITAQAYDNFLSKEKKKQGAVVDPDNPESIKGFSSFVSSSGNAILNMSAMQSISELQESVSSKGTMDFGDYASKLSVKSIALPIPFSGTANQIIQGARYLSGDKTAQAAIGADEKIYKELGLAGIVYNRPVLDWRGRPVNAVLQNQEGIASFVSMLDKRPLDKIDMYLLKELEFNPVIDKRLSENFADLNMVGMSKDEYYDYTKNVGRTVNNYIEAYFDKIKDYQIPQDKIDELAAEGKNEADLKKQLKTIKKTFVSDFLNIAEQEHMLNYQFKKGIIKEAYEAKVRANNDRLKNLIEKINDKGE